MNQFGISSRLGFTQVGYTVVGIVMFFIVKQIGRKFIIANIQSIFWIFFALLIITFLVGIEVKGSRRWLDLGFVNFQPSEFLKIWYVAYLAQALATVRKNSLTATFYITHLVTMALPAAIVLFQPDLGNALVFVGIFCIMMICSDMPKIYLLRTMLFGALLTPIIWLFLHDYQRNRVLSFIQPSQDLQGTAYNMIQAVITTGSGGFFGKGLGMGTQSKLSFLPENHTDFAFSSLVEQFGFVGGLVVICAELALIALLLQRAYRFLQHSDTDSQYKYYYALGIAAVLLIQVIVNIGMNLGLLPIAGIALPFISAGGSMFVAVCIGFALVKS
jgi:rod shape determining protein RodA